MKKIITICFLLIAAGNCFGQIKFQKTIGGSFGDGANCAQQTADGGYIIVGRIDNSGSGDDIYLIKIDALGDSLWIKTFGGTNDDIGYSVQQTADGGYIIAGTTLSFNAGGYTNIYLVKTDANGNSLWTKTFGGIFDDYCYSILQTSDGGYVITGYLPILNSNNPDAYLIKLNGNGDSLWTKAYGVQDYEFGYSLQQTTDGGYIIAGEIYSISAGNSDILLVRTDSVGNSLWTKTFGGTGYEEGYSVQQTSDGGYIIAGFTNSFGAGDYDAYLIKADSNGSYLWSKTFGGTDNDYGNSVQQTIDGGYILTGTTGLGAGGSKVYLIKTDSNGDAFWSRYYGGTWSDGGKFVQQTADGGYFIAGSTSSFSTSVDIYLIKTDSSGNSGCGQAFAPTIETSPSTQVTSPATMISSCYIVPNTPATVIGSSGTVTTLCSTVGINAISNFNLRIFISPNPATNNFTITFPNTINKGVIEIYDVMGKKIFTENIFNVSQKEVTLKNVEAGIYFVKVRDGEKEFCKKLVIQ